MLKERDGRAMVKKFYKPDINSTGIKCTSIRQLSQSSIVLFLAANWENELAESEIEKLMTRIQKKTTPGLAPVSMAVQPRTLASRNLVGETVS